MKLATACIFLQRAPSLVPHQGIHIICFGRNKIRAPNTSNLRQYDVRNVDVMSGSPVDCEFPPFEEAKGTVQTPNTVLCPTSLPL